MTIRINPSQIITNSEINIPGSKSETNRLLILQALYPNLQIENASFSDDSQVVVDALKTDSDTINVGHAGTAMRFLTAYFSTAENRIVTLTGSDRMTQRPIKILVDALRSIGAEIEYLGTEGFPPLKIVGQPLSESFVELPANISSQYISALLLIAPKLENGLKISLLGNITSRPYINMTLALLSQIGVTSTFVGNTIIVAPRRDIPSVTFTVESDWSAASYYYSIVALSPLGWRLRLKSFREDSVQGDSKLMAIYKLFGVDSRFEDDYLVLSRIAIDQKNIELDLNDTPDIAQTIAVTCLALQIDCRLRGLQTLSIKETDRLKAMKIEIEKLGGRADISDDELRVYPIANLNENITIETYHDHRMAMSFAPIGLKTSIFIADAMVVTKSYPNFWEDLVKIGFDIDRWFLGRCQW